ncbi:MAG: flavodoxin family protein [Bacillota bacterium]
MLIIGINGSPRPNGGTAQLLGYALEEAAIAGAQTVFFHAIEGLRSAKVPYCIHCSNPCEGICYRGTRLDEMYAVMSRADGLIIGSPVYFGTVAAPMKAFWDKTRKLRKEKSLVNVVGGGVVCGASRFGGQEATLQALTAMMLCQGMTVIGDGHQGEDPGHLGACMQYGVDAYGDGPARARVLGRRVVDVSRATQVLRVR